MLRESAAPTGDLEGKAHHDVRDDVPAIIESVCEARADVLAQPVGQREVRSLDLQVHGIPRARLDDNRRIIRALIVRYKQA
jgi:hypothetical protein